MALTAAEQAELDELERRDHEREQEDKGSQHVATVQAAQPPQRTPRPFSLYRFTVGSLRDAAQGVQDTFEDVIHSPALREQIIRQNPIAGVAANLVNEAQAKLFGRDPVSGHVELPHLKGEEDAGTVERVARGIGSFLVPFTAASKAVGVTRAASWLGRAGRATLAGGIADFAQIDPVSGNMANMLRDTFGIDNKTLDALASEEDDDALLNRFKAAAVNAPVGIAADALFETGFRAVKAYRAWKGTAEEAEETVKSLKKDYPIEPVKPAKVAPANDNAAAAGKAGPEDAEFWHVPPEYNPARDASAQPQPQSFEDVLDYLKRQAGTEVDEKALGRLADNLLWGNPENALAKLGIDPAKLDFSLYDNPDMIARLQKGLGEVYETIASKLGRSNIRVTERATIEAARTLASTADVLKDVHGATANLAEGLTGARMFIGAHAHKLLSNADAAIKEITAGVSDGHAWNDFLASFHRHAYYLGVVRGAGSEVGRALRSLQIIGKVVKPQEANDLLGKALGQDAKASRVLDAVKSKIETGASDYADRLGTPAERLDALTKLKALGGDVGELSREVRRQNGSSFRRIDDALRETVGNLFGPATAMRNMMAGSAMMGTRLMAKGLVAVSRMALSPLGGRFSREARVTLMDTWAYADGIVSGFRAAYAATLDVLGKEGFAEVAHTLDTMGLKDLALKTAGKSASADERLVGQSYERTDVKNHRAFGISATEQLALNRKIEELSGPEFYKTALGYLAKAGSTLLNGAGTLSRSGTIAFINLPDQFIGTLAARAGAYSSSVRIAASEAAELSLEGRDLSAYLKARAVQIMGDTKGWHPDPIVAGHREAVAGVGEHEAREVLFQDDLELTGGLARFLGNTPLLHLVVPFVKTPLRILERTAIDYTPLGIAKDRVRRAIMAGGPQGEEAMARIALGTLATTTAFMLAADRTIVGQDGGLASSARLSRGSYSLKIGDDQVEFNYVDPLGTLLGFGADMNSFMHAMEDDPEAPDHLQQMFEASIWATSMNILSKTWLTSLKNLTDLAGIQGDGSDIDVRTTRFLSQFAARFVPASGAQRQAEKVLDGYTHQAITFSDALLKGSLGSDKLPLKRDTIIGRPVPVEGLDRLIGVRAAPAAGNDDPLLKELEHLSFDLPSPRRTVLGVKLNGSQFSRYLELRGQVLKKPDTGLTLEGTLTKLITLPEYQTMTRRQRIEAVRQEMDGFSNMATDALLKEDKDFAYRALRKETYDRVLLQGGDTHVADAETRRFAAQIGLTPTE